MMSARPRSDQPGRRGEAGLWIIAIVAATAACGEGPVAGPPEGAVDLAAPWAFAGPEAVGLDPNALFVAAELAGRIERMRSLLVVRHGRMAYERYYGGWSPDTLADARSVTKVVVSTLVGVAIAEGRIESLDQPLTDFLGPPRQPVRDEHGSIRLRHLLTMSGGFEWAESSGDEYAAWAVSADPVAHLLARPLSAAPGTAFRYNSAAIHLLGVVLEEATGTSLDAYADRALLGPLGIGERRWEVLGDGRANGGSGLALRPRDLARLGQLFLQEGWSGDRSIVVPEWIDEATRPRYADLGRVGPVEALSMGYLWWLDLERGAFFAWGFAGQLVLVVPGLDIVVVALTEWRGVDDDIGSERLREEVLRIVVERVLPAAR